jgi:hypothetical protein
MSEMDLIKLAETMQAIFNQLNADPRVLNAITAIGKLLQLSLVHMPTLIAQNMELQQQLAATKLELLQLRGEGDLVERPGFADTLQFRTAADLQEKDDGRNDYGEQVNVPRY